MKKGLFIGAGVVALLVVMVWADHKFPPPGTTSASAPAKPMDAPVVTMKDLNDKDVTLQQYKGEVVLVNFWATWCAPCKAEIPSLIEFQQKFGPRGFTILGISMDEDGKKAVEPFLEKQRFDVNGQQEAMSYPILLGSDAVGDKFGGIVGLPTSMLFNRDGKRVRTILGPVNPDDISKAIEGLLQ
jgi:cytochrome c biogenesis protein CcmG, thiol:disulfide interchange protein DsbE